VLHSPDELFEVVGEQLGLLERCKMAASGHKRIEETMEPVVQYSITPPSSRSLFCKSVQGKSRRTSSRVKPTRKGRGLGEAVPWNRRTDDLKRQAVLGIGEEGENLVELKEGPRPTMDQHQWPGDLSVRERLGPRPPPAISKGNGVDLPPAEQIQSKQAPEPHRTRNRQDRQLGGVPAGETVANAGLVGGLSDADINEKGVQNALQFAVVQHNKGSNDMFVSQVSKVIKVQKQVNSLKTK
ncbi:hypothetical protein JZ751_006369, partial [Albula glossodonta]